jgi:hypothetical protein
MEHALGTGDAQRGDAQDARVTAARATVLRCDICQHQLGKSIFFVEETGEVPRPRRSWVLCDECNAAVHEQVERSTVHTDIRLRVAVGIVSTDRTPAARRAHFGQLSDRSWMKVFFWLFLLTMLVHLAIIVAIAGIVK